MQPLIIHYAHSLSPARPRLDQLQPFPIALRSRETTRRKPPGVIRGDYAVKLSNCAFERVGDKNDGGYLVCKNLSARLTKPVHQYDCFNVDHPPCEGATPVFHAECVGPEKATIEGRPFDTVEVQVARNGDAGKRLIMKMDVEGSEWQSFLEMPESVMQQVDQLTVECHGVEEKDYAPAINRLRKFFHVVNVHYNNWTCSPDVKPLQATTFEVLL